MTRNHGLIALKELCNLIECEPYCLILHCDSNFGLIVRRSIDDDIILVFHTLKKLCIRYMQMDK